MNRSVLLAGILLAAYGCQSLPYASAPFQSQGFEFLHGTANDFASPHSVCIQFNKESRRQFLPPSDGSLEGLPPCDRPPLSPSIVQVAFFLLGGCSSGPCRTPLSAHVVIHRKSASASWRSTGGESPQDVVDRFAEELSRLLFPTSSQ
jgi:hypothetical protein